MFGDIWGIEECVLAAFTFEVILEIIDLMPPSSLAAFTVRLDVRTAYME